MIIQRKKRLDARRKIAHNGYASRQIAQTFFATVADKQHAACRPGIQSVKNIHQRQHARHVCRVIANARTIQSSSLLAHRHGLKIGEYRIDVRHDDDDILIYRVTEIADDKVVLDGNHPLAGMALVFTCTVTSIRPASAEEIEHGHVHEDGDCEHDD